jgi:hypothetical protein
VTKKIQIIDSRDISVEADLVIPAFTFEGHTELAQDQSTFEVDGVPYSAVRAYAEDVADNDFKCDSSYVDIERLNDTKAEATFMKEGNYSVRLNIRTATAGTLRIRNRLKSEKLRILSTISPVSKSRTGSRFLQLPLPLFRASP